jgi:hypothetical protein
MRTNIVASRAIDAVAGANFKKRAKHLNVKDAFYFSRIGANRVAQTTGRLCWRCLLYGMVADKSCSAQEKIKLPIIESSRRGRCSRLRRQT